MDLEPDDDQIALRDELRRFLDDRVTSEARREIAGLPGAVDRGLFKELAGRGVFSLTRPEADGGVGLGWAEAAIVFEELGRAAVPGPLIGTFLAAGLAERADRGAGADSGGPVDLSELAAGAAGGETVVGLVPGPDARWVEHLDGLDALVILDVEEGHDGLSVVRAGLSGVAHERPLDPLTPVSSLDASLPAVPVGAEEVGRPYRRAAGLLAAAQQVGLARGALDMGVDYAKERTQFGRAIGSFQAVKHLLADARASVEVARAAVHAAGVAMDEASGEAAGAADEALDPAVDSARVVASSAAQRSTTTSIQVHGGMGYTWELDAHLFLKRAMVLDQTAPSVETAHERLADGAGR